MKWLVVVGLLFAPLQGYAQEPWRVVEVSSGVALAVQSVAGASPKQATVGYFFATPTDTHANGDFVDYSLVGMEFDCYTPQTRALLQKNYHLSSKQPSLVGEAVGKWERIIHPSQQKVWESVCGVKDHALARIQTPGEIIKWLHQTHPHTLNE